jgi:hypothetical protein
MSISVDTTLTLAELRNLIADEEAKGRVEGNCVVCFDVSVDTGSAFDALLGTGYMEDWLADQGPGQLQLRDLHDAVAEVRRGNLPMALVLFGRLLESDAEFDVVERALRERPAAGLLQ